jgi:hypothetical protein
VPEDLRLIDDVVFIFLSHCFLREAYGVERNPSHLTPNP